mgnify:CR=1 FL=1
MNGKNMTEIELALEAVNNALLMAMCGEILQAIYDSEINYSISSPCWDGGFTAQLGGEFDSDRIVNDNCYKLVDAVKWIMEKVFEQYPESTFTQKYKPILKSRERLIKGPKNEGFGAENQKISNQWP